MTRFFIKASIASLVFGAFQFPAFARGTAIQTVTCDGMKSENGDGGASYGYQFVREENGKYKVRTYQYDWDGRPDPSPPYSGFLTEDFTCEFNTGETTGGRMDMRYSVRDVADCFKLVEEQEWPHAWDAEFEPYCAELFPEDAVSSLSVTALSIDRVIQIMRQNTRFVLSVLP